LGCAKINAGIKLIIAAAQTGNNPKKTHVLIANATASPETAPDCH
jgi:hypothetical protein